MNTVYKSKFLKANSREEQPIQGGTSFVCHNNKNIVVRDLFLLPGTAIELKLSKDDLNILLPIAGMLRISEENRTINPEAQYCYCSNVDKVISVINPFTDETINFLHISIDSAAHSESNDLLEVEHMTVDTRNKLIKGSGAASCIKVGVYDSRIKDNVRLNDNCSGLFTYVINGSFDFEERLLEYRDGLYQWDVENVEFEALSETAIILLIECSPLK